MPPADLEPAFIAGAAAIIGAFIGGTSAAVASYLADRRRFQREDEYRDHAERREAYARFLAACNRIRAEADYGPEAGAELRESTMTAMLITRSLEVAGAINALGEIVTDIAMPRDDSERQGALAKYHPAVVDSLDAARNDLRITSEARVSWWRRVFGS